MSSTAIVASGNSLLDCSCVDIALAPPFLVIGNSVDGRTLCAEELARDVEGLAADHNNLLAVEQLFRNSAGQTAEQMALAVNPRNPSARS